MSLSEFDIAGQKILVGRVSELKEAGDLLVFLAFTVAS